jgi:DsbC/DsbD-like thiol-disulfide interchange protein
MLFSIALLVTVSNGEEKPIRKAELLILESDRPSIVTVGLHIELARDWYLYWANPGDAGLAPEVSWELSPGYEAGPLRFPVPEKMIYGDIVTYGFKNELLVLCEIRPSGRLTPTVAPAIACRLGWMACRESCVTGRDTVKPSPAALTPAALKRSHEILSRFAPRFPRPLDTSRVAIQEAGLFKSGTGWRVEITLSGKDAARVSDFYPYPLENFVFAHSRIVRSGKKMIIPLEPSSPSATLARVDGLLILGDAAYEVSVPVKLIAQPS